MRMSSVLCFIMSFVTLIFVILTEPAYGKTDPIRLATALAVALVFALLAIAAAILDSYETVKDDEDALD